MTTSYDQLFTFGEISFIAGTDKVMTFSTEDENGAPLDITGADVAWYLCPYGQYNNAVLYKEGVLATAYTFTITLDSEDTLSLSGKFIQQVVITDYLGNQFRPAQGNIIILPAIGQNANPIYLSSGVIGRLLDVYPIGSIYLSVSTSNPSPNFGGTWVDDGTLTADETIYVWKRTG